jgi:hypothetical protein
MIRSKEEIERSADAAHPGPRSDTKRCRKEEPAALTLRAG